MRNVITGLGFIAAISYGYFVSTRAWQGRVFIPTADERAPAAVGDLKQYAAVDGRTLSQSAHAQLIDLGQRHDRSPARLDFARQPVLRRGDRREFACAAAGQPGVFDRIEASFYGVGVMDHGEAPRVTIDAPCRGGDAADRLAVFRIPTVEGAAADPGRERALREHPLVVPRDVTLDQVRFYRGRDAATELNISAEYLRQPKANLLTFAWPKIGVSGCRFPWLRTPTRGTRHFR